MASYNDLDLRHWKDYEDLYTDDLWVIDHRDGTGAHSPGYWGNFVPQIPYQLLSRFTKAGEWVLDPFCGSGTTLIEAQRLGRNSIGIELNPDTAQNALLDVDSERRLDAASRAEIFTGDSRLLDLQEVLRKCGTESVQFVILHPPYWNIIRFSQQEGDLSACATLEEFLEFLDQVIENAVSVLDDNRFCALVIGDKYQRGEHIPLSFYAMQLFQKRGFLLKSIIVKNFEETRGKHNQRALWRYRALAGGFYVFKHEYIMLFQKRPQKKKRRSKASPREAVPEPPDAP